MADSTKYMFKVTWWDTQSSIDRDYILTYFESENGSENQVQFYDPKNRRMFIRKYPCPSIKPKDLYIGSKISFLSRQFEIQSCADEKTSQRFGQRTSKLFSIIGYRNIGSIISAANQNGFTISKLKSIVDRPTGGIKFALEVVGEEGGIELWNSILGKLGGAEESSLANDDTDKIFFFKDHLSHF